MAAGGGRKRKIRCARAQRSGSRNRFGFLDDLIDGDESSAIERIEYKDSYGKAT